MSSTPFSSWPSFFPPPARGFHPKTRGLSLSVRSGLSVAFVVVVVVVVVAAAAVEAAVGRPRADRAKHEGRVVSNDGSHAHLSCSSCSTCLLHRASGRVRSSFLPSSSCICISPPSRRGRCRSLAPCCLRQCLSPGKRRKGPRKARRRSVNRLPARTAPGGDAPGEELDGPDRRGEGNVSAAPPTRNLLLTHDFPPAEPEGGRLHLAQLAVRGGLRRPRPRPNLFLPIPQLLCQVVVVHPLHRSGKNLLVASAPGESRARREAIPAFAAITSTSLSLPSPSRPLKIERTCTHDCRLEPSDQQPCRSRSQPTYDCQQIKKVAYDTSLLRVLLLGQNNLVAVRDGRIQQRRQV